MSKAIYYCTLIVLGGVLAVVTVIAPHVLSDKNAFLKNFVNHELLAILAVIVSITLASTSSLHLELNRIEERYKKVGFQATRAGVRQAAYWLIALLAIATILVLAKGGLCLNDTGESFFNGAALFIVAWNLLILLTITRTVFRIAPNIPDEEEA